MFLQAYMLLQGSFSKQSLRNLRNRVEEHWTIQNSLAVKHLQVNQLESLLLQQHKPEVTANIPMWICTFRPVLQILESAVTSHAITTRTYLAKSRDC